MKDARTLFAELSDEELIDRVRDLASHERRATAQLVAGLAELERRRLFLPLGYSSLFVYCTRALHLSEYAAYNRIEAARATWLFPSILGHLEAGSLTLSAVRLLAPILTPDNCERLLAAAMHQSKRDIERLVVGERPLSEVATVVRRLPTHRGITTKSERSGLTDDLSRAGQLQVEESRPWSATPRPISTPLTPERFKIQFTASREFHDKLRRAQALLRHTVPNGDPAIIFERALDLLVATREKRKTAATNQPRQARPAAHSRHIPAAVKREVWKRDGGRCAFAGRAGRCGEEAFLEFHHVVPFADGGAATTANIALRCRAHNAYEADRIFTPMSD